MTRPFAPTRPSQFPPRAGPGWRFCSAKRPARRESFLRTSALRRHRAGRLPLRSRWMSPSDDRTRNIMSECCHCSPSCLLASIGHGGAAGARRRSTRQPAPRSAGVKRAPQPHFLLIQRRGHTYLFISVSCFPLAQSGGVVLGMMMLLAPFQLAAALHLMPLLSLMASARAARCEASELAA